jgi:tetratricopeptide (TPR) repeat protein
MAFLKIFAGKTPREHEHKGDVLFADNLWGKAKVEYEKALEKLKKNAASNDESKNRLREKIRRTKEALANNHRRNADEMLEAGFYDDARELYYLALELSEDSDLKNSLEDKLRQLDFRLDKIAAENLPDDPGPQEKAAEGIYLEQDDEHFSALCGTLPPEIQKSYQGYGDSFKKGYLALNRGEFARAAEFLNRALEENPSSGAYIPLELATAYLNMGKLAEAQRLLEDLVSDQPRALPAYQLLCEIYWENKAFERTEALLSSVPEELQESVAVYLLKGETLFRAGNFSAAKDFYRNFSRAYGFNALIARELAKTHEALQELANARSLYREIMDQCRSCHANIDPLIKQRYADLCFDSGMLNTEVLELYLSLARELPESAADFYEKVSRIYAARENDHEARRFRALAEKLGSKQPEPARRPGAKDGS